MMIDDNFLEIHHINQQFDAELTHLHLKLLKLMRQVLEQWDLTIESLETANLDLAVTVLSQSSEIDECVSIIDHLVVTLLARESPVARDLRMTLAISKVAGELRYLSEEVSEIARLILVLYEPRSVYPHAQISSTILCIIEDIRNIMVNLNAVLCEFDGKLAHWILACDVVYEKEIQRNIAQQLTFINNDPRQIKSGLIVLQIIKSLESSIDHCKDLAKFCILMIDGEDLRHSRP